MNRPDRALVRCSPRRFAAALAHRGRSRALLARLAGKDVKVAHGCAMGGPIRWGSLVALTRVLDVDPAELLLEEPRR
jgi:hypothetical protein